MQWNDLAKRNLQDTIRHLGENQGTTYYFVGGELPAKSVPMIFDDREDFLDVDAELSINTRVIHAVVDSEDLESIIPARNDEVEARGIRYLVIDVYQTDGEGYILMLGRA